MSLPIFEFANKSCFPKEQCLLLGDYTIMDMNEEVLGAESMEVHSFLGWQRYQDHKNPNKTTSLDQKTMSVLEPKEEFVARSRTNTESSVQSIDDRLDEAQDRAAACLVATFSLTTMFLLHAVSILFFGGWLKGAPPSLTPQNHP